MYFAQADTGEIGKFRQFLKNPFKFIEKTERLGIFVETNPTSNLTIGDFSKMKDHPLFRSFGRMFITAIGLLFLKFIKLLFYVLS